MTSTNALWDKGLGNLAEVVALAGGGVWEVAMVLGIGVLVVTGILLYMDPKVFGYKKGDKS